MTKTKITVLPQIARFNAFIDRYDLLTLYHQDRATPEQIWIWFKVNDPIIFPIFDDTVRAAGYYFNGKQQLYGI